MLAELKQELNVAIANATKVEDRFAEDGQTLEYRKSVLTFKGTEVQIISKRRPGSGLGDEAKYDVTIFVPATKQIVEHLFEDKLIPETDKLVRILQAMEAYSQHDELVRQRIAEAQKASSEQKSKEWLKKLEGTPFTDQQKKLFTDHAATVISNPKTAVRAEVFINALKEFSVKIIAEDLEACGVLQEAYKPKYTLLDTIYNVVCQLLENQVPNKHGDNFIPLSSIQHRILNMEAELNKMPTYVRAARAFLRELWSFCHESAATFCFVLTGLSKYYEVVTGESVELRIAKNNARSKNRPQKPINHQPVQFGNLGEFLESAGLKK